MPKCERIRRKHRKVCIGDLNEVIDIQTRSLDDGFDDTETESFTTLISPFALVETLQGVFVVDSVSGGDAEATHRFTIRVPDEEISGENWVLFKGKRYRILDQEDLEERNEWLRLLCTSRGATTREATSA